MNLFGKQKNQSQRNPFKKQVKKNILISEPSQRGALFVPAATFLAPIWNKMCYKTRDKKWPPAELNSFTGITFCHKICCIFCSFLESLFAKWVTLFCKNCACLDWDLVWRCFFFYMFFFKDCPTSTPNFGCPWTGHAHREMASKCRDRTDSPSCVRFRCPNRPKRL